MTVDDKNKEALVAEVDRLTAELAMAATREQDLADTRRAMLYLLEDINEGASIAEKARTEWEAIFDSISDLLFVHDAQMRIVRCNRAYKNAASMKFKEIIGRPYYEVFPVMDGPFDICTDEVSGERAESEARDMEVSSSGRVFRFKYYFLKDGSRGARSIHVMEDITSEKAYEEKIALEMELNKRLLMISNATVHTTDIVRVMEQVTGCLHKIMRSDMGLSYIWDAERKCFASCRASGLDQGQVPFFTVERLDPESGFVARALKERRPIIENFGPDYAMAHGCASASINNDGPLGWAGDISTAVVFPLIGRPGCLGLLIAVYAGGKAPPQFGKRDREVWDSISYQVSTALDEARLYKDSIDRTMELSRKVETIRTMHDIDLAILSAVHIDSILDTAARMVGKAVVCDRATIALVDKEREGFRYAAGYGTCSVEKGAFIDFKETSATELVKTGIPQYVADLRETGHLLPLEKKLLGEGFVSHIRVPLTVKGDVVGVLVTGSKRVAAFSSEDLSILEKLASQIGIALENGRLLSDIEELFIGTVKTLSEAIDAKSPWTRGHSERVTSIALDIGRELGFGDPEIKKLELAGLLHDIGKLGTYEYILDKPGKLTDEEQEIMRQHPQKGAEILAPIKQLSDICPIIKHHHEYYDGTGYPDGLKGEDIPIMARMLSVADTVDAMGADRPYRKGKPMTAIIAELERCAGTQFDSDIVSAFLKTGRARGQ